MPQAVVMLFKPYGIDGLAGPLEVPAYGYERGGQFYRPKKRETAAAFVQSINPFRSNRRWTNYISLLGMFGLGQAFFYFIFFRFEMWPFIGGLLFVWLIDLPIVEAISHRGFNHGAFRPRSKWTLLVLRLICPIDLPDELFQVAHTVHHQISDRPGDPFNARGGLFNLFFTDYLQQHLRWDLTRDEYAIVVNRLKPFTLYQNTYEQYRRWGTVTHPLAYFIELSARRTIRYFVAILVFGSQFLAYSAAAFLGNLFVRSMNYFVHGGGEPKHRDGIEFHRSDLSYNHWCLIWAIGQRHNYHHQFPKSATTAFFPWQIDHSFYWIKLFKKLGLVVDVIDSKKSFLKMNGIGTESISRTTMTSSSLQ